MHQSRLLETKTRIEPESFSLVSSPRCLVTASSQISETEEKKKAEGKLHPVMASLNNPRYRNCSPVDLQKSRKTSFLHPIDEILTSVFSPCDKGSHNENCHPPRRTFPKRKSDSDNVLP